MPGGMLARFLLLVLVLLAAPALAFAQAPACPQLFAGGQPPALLNPKLGQRTTLLCNDAFAVLASGVTRSALWSAEHPTAASLDAARDTPREGQFHAEERLPPGDQARLEDYRRSGYDRGHMVPSADMPDAESQQQTFSLANMVPQTPELNRGVWAGIEMAVRHLAERRGELYIVTGPAFQGGNLATIGPSGVLVPSATWKAVHDPRSGGAGAYVCSNTASPRCATVSVATLSGTVGIDPFPSLPDNVKAAAMTLPRPEASPYARGHRRRRHESQG